MKTNDLQKHDHKERITTAITERNQENIEYMNSYFNEGGFHEVISTLCVCINDMLKVENEDPTNANFIYTESFIINAVYRLTGTISILSKLHNNWALNNKHHE